MRTSHIIEVSGRFAGAAINHDGRYRFVAVDPRTEELNNSLWPSLADVQRVVRHFLARPLPSQSRDDEAGLGQPGCAPLMSQAGV